MPQLDVIFRDVSQNPCFTDPVGAYPVRFDTLATKIAFWRQKYQVALLARQLTIQKECLWHLEMLAHYWNRFVPLVGDPIDTGLNPGTRQVRNGDGTPSTAFDDAIEVIYMDRFGLPSALPFDQTPFANATEMARHYNDLRGRIQRETARALTDPFADRMMRKRIGSLVRDTEYQAWNAKAAGRLEGVEFPDPPPGMPYDWRWAQNFTRYSFSQVRAMLERKGYKCTIYRSPRNRPGEWDWAFTAVRGGAQDTIILSGLVEYMLMFDVQHNALQEPFFVQNFPDRGTPLQGIPLSMRDITKWNVDGVYDPKEMATYRSGWLALRQWITKSV